MVLFVVRVMEIARIRVMVEVRVRVREAIILSHVIFLFKTLCNYNSPKPNQICP